MDHDHVGHETPPSFWGSRYSIGLLVFGAAAAYFLLTEHLAHVISALPLLLLAVCPLMHMFMHHGHGGHGNHPSDDTASGSGKPDQPKAGDRS